MNSPTEPAYWVAASEAGSTSPTIAASEAGSETSTMVEPNNPGPDVGITTSPASGDDTTHFHSLDLRAYIPLLDRLAAEEEASVYYDDGKQILILLDTAKFDKCLVSEMKVIINMVKHMNNMLYKKTESSPRLSTTTIKEVKALANQVACYLEGMEKQFDAILANIKQVRSGLPGLDEETDPRHIKVGLKIWASTIIASLAPPRECERRLWIAFDEFFNAQIYSAFLQICRENNEHDICEFADVFHAISDTVHVVQWTYEEIIKEMRKMSNTMKAARKRLLSSPQAYLKEYKVEQMYRHHETQSEAPSAITPSSPIRDITAMNEKEKLEEEKEFHQIVETIQHSLTLKKGEDKGKGKAQ